MQSPMTQFTVLKARFGAIGDRPQTAFARFIGLKKDGLPQNAARLDRALAGLIALRRQRLEGVGQLLVSLSYKSVLARGYALVRGADGRAIRSAAAIAPGQPLAIEFADGTARATADGAPRGKRKAGGEAGQGTLFER
jgi:exodeoxyribonuclease VII large subunit